MYIHAYKYTVDWENFVIKLILYRSIFTKIKLKNVFSNIDFCIPANCNLDNASISDIGEISKTLCRQIGQYSWCMIANSNFQR